MVISSVVLVYFIDRSLNAAGYSTQSEGETGTPAGSPSTHVQRLFSRRHKMKYLKWYIVAVLLIIATVMMTCCTHVVPYTSVVYKNIGTDQGQSDCDANGEPVIYLNEDSTRIMSVHYTRIHEYEHVARIRRFKGGCKAFLRRYDTDSVFALDEEAMAYCAEARAMIWDGKEGKAVIQLITLWLKAHPVGKPFTLEVVTEHVPCRYLADTSRTLLGRVP